MAQMSELSKQLAKIAAQARLISLDPSIDTADRQADYGTASFDRRI
jgi:hypothetical protein